MTITTVEEHRSWEYGFRMRLPKLPKVKRPAWLSLPKVSKNTAHLASQAVGVLSVLVGVSMWSVPCAFILGGLTVVFAIERQ